MRKHDPSELQLPAEASCRISVPGIGTSTPVRPITRLLTIDEIAELLNTSSRTVRRLMESRALAVHRFGRVVRIAEADLAAFLANTRTI